MSIMHELDSLDDEKYALLVIVHSGGGYVYEFNAIKMRLLELSEIHDLTIFISYA